jgi:glucose/arabinose dehydrogenase
MCPRFRVPTNFIIVLLGVSICITIFIIRNNNNYIDRPYAFASLEAELPEMPIIYDSSLKAELVFQREIDREGGTLSPVSSMTFLDKDDILILNKNEGIVNRIVNSVLLKEPLLDVNVANKRERGMLGIAATSDSVSANTTRSQDLQHVFLYYTESQNKDGSDICKATYICISDKETKGNQLYSYELRNGKLVDPRLLLHLPSWPAPAHNGGTIRIGPDNNLYVTTGDLVGSDNESSRTRAQNYRNGTEPDGRAGILRVTLEGKPVSDGILGNEFPVDLYYAYGIRNSFGIDFDPITGQLWDTENGPDYGDEINIVKPGFNSGWYKLQGVWKPRYDSIRGGDLIAGDKLLVPDVDYLENFDGKGEYSQPEFTWNYTVGPTALKFLHSDSYPKFYKDDLFVGDTNNGYLYHFDLNEDRTSLKLDGVLSDKIADNPEELKEIIFGVNFGQITDIDVSPDGYLYILSHYKNKATIFKIVSSN